ncbi:hypothetical protein BDV18DRAFT_155413 [Aspergillus unguis]
MSLEDLPLEILSLILTQLGFYFNGTLYPDPRSVQYHDASLGTAQPSWYSLKLQPLLRLCLVSKRLCNVIQPILYQEFMLGYGDSWRSESYYFPGRLVSFMRTVAQRWDLAACVKRLHVHPYLLEATNYRPPGRAPQVWVRHMGFFCGPDITDPGPSYPILFPYISDEEASEAIQAVSKLFRIQKRQRISADDLLTLLIAALPNLELCSLILGPDPEGDIVRSAVLSAAAIPKLPIKTIEISPVWGGTSEDDLISLEKRFRQLFEFSPYLETLRLDCCTETWQKEPVPSLPNLKNITLRSSCLTNIGLDKLLSSCKALERFTYESLSSIRSSKHFQMCDAIRSLSRFTTTLESLELDLRKRGKTYLAPTMFNLQSFAALKHLLMNMDELHSTFWAGSSAGTDYSQVLVGFLPPNLVSLHLVGGIGDELPRLESALLGLADAAFQGRFQSLREIKWNQSERLNDEDAILSSFADTKVIFIYHSWPRSGYSSPRPNFLDPPPEQDWNNQGLPDETDPDL